MNGTLSVGVALSGTLVQPALTSWSADTSQRFSVEVDMSAVLEFEADATPPSVLQFLDRHSVTMPTPTLDALGRPVQPWTPSDAVTPWGRLQVIAEGVHTTMLRGAPAPGVSWGSAEPGGDTAMVLDLPQVSPFEALGTGDRAKLADGSRVALYVVRPNGTKLRLFTGEVVSPETQATETSGSTLLHVQGILFTADNSVTPPSFHSEARDVGTVIAECLNGYVSKKYATCRPVTTGITTRTRGAWTPRLSGYVQDLLALATTNDGSSQWTVKQTGLVPSIVLKDRTTVHATVSVGAPGVSLNLASDRTGAPNVIFGEGTAPDGGHWRNTKYPNLRVDDAPIYPLAPGSTFSAGSSTAGFAPFALERRENGYSTIVSGNTYAAADVDEVRDAQNRAGITVDGIVGPQTWAAIFAVGSNGGDLSGAYFAPLAFDTRVMPYKYNAQGATIGRNPAYDPTVLRVERFENFGEGVTKHQGVVSARAELARISSPGIAGTVTLKVDPQEMSRFELRAGMNLRLQHYRGASPLLHIAGVQVDWKAQTVTLTVDDKARDLMTLAAIRARNEDAATDPVRRNLPSRRQSRLTKDTTVVFDSDSGAGLIPRLALFRGLWTVIRIPAGQLGSIARTVMTTDSPAAPFAAGVFKQSVTANDLVRLVGNPLTSTKPWSTQADALIDAGLLIAWGSPTDPAGYWPDTLSAGGTVTGRLIDDATWYYESTKPPWLWVAMFSSSSCFISGQMFGSPDGV